MVRLTCPMVCICAQLHVDYLMIMYALTVVDVGSQTMKVGIHANFANADTPTSYTSYTLSSRVHI